MVRTGRASLPTVDFRKRNLQPLAEIAGGVEEREARCVAPEFQLIAAAMTGVAVIRVGSDVDDEEPRVLAALKETATTQVITAAAEGLKAQ